MLGFKLDHVSKRGPWFVLLWLYHGFLWRVNPYLQGRFPITRWSYECSAADEVTMTLTPSHDDVIKWKHFPRYWTFVRGIHRSPVNSPHKGQWRRASMVSLICAWINGWVNNGEAGDLTRHWASSLWRHCNEKQDTCNTIHIHIIFSSNDYYAIHFISHINMCTYGEREREREREGGGEGERERERECSRIFHYLFRCWFVYYVDIVIWTPHRVTCSSRIRMESICGDMKPT